MTYPTQFPEWLNHAASSGRGGLSAEPPSIVRGFARSFVLNLNSHVDYDDWTDGAFTAELRASPDAGGAALATWTITTGMPASGVTPITFTLLSEDQGSLPADGGNEGLTEALMQVTYTPSGGVADPIIQTRIVIAGAV